MSSENKSDDIEKIEEKIETVSEEIEEIVPMSTSELTGELFSHFLPENRGIERKYEDFSEEERIHGWRQHMKETFDQKPTKTVYTYQMLANALPTFIINESGKDNPESVVVLDKKGRLSNVDNRGEPISGFSLLNLPQLVKEKFIEE